MLTTEGQRAFSIQVSHVEVKVDVKVHLDEIVAWIRRTKEFRRLIDRLSVEKYLVLRNWKEMLLRLNYSLFEGDETHLQQLRRWFAVKW